MGRTDELNTAIEQQKETIRNLEQSKAFAVKEDLFEKSAIETKLIYDSYIKAGFTEEQAWELLQILFSRGGK
jgi:hypothetical protein